MKRTMKTTYYSGNAFVWVPKMAVLLIIALLSTTYIQAQSLTGSTWDLGTATAGSGYTNWANNGVISLTDTTTGAANTCRGSAVTETSGYNPTTNFSKCFRVFFGCPSNDQIGTLDPGGCPSCPYTDQNGDGLAFSFWENTGTFSANNANTCGGGLGYHNGLNGSGNGKMITIEFDTYSSLGTSGVDGSYGGGAPGSGINDEISIHKDEDSGDSGLITAGGTVNAGNLEDGLEHDVCITYNAGTHILAVTIDGTSKISYDLGATYNFNTYFSGTTLNYTWSAGEYGATNLQTIGPAGSQIFATMGHNPCTHAVVMPVRLISFTGELTNETVLLNWATATETNNAKFIIERSADGVNWASIGEVAGAGSISSIVNYNFIDNAPLNGIAYYRLKQVDVDGTSTLSSVIAVQTGGDQSVHIGPNPFDDALTITSSVKGNLDISISDVLGKQVYHVNQKNDTGTFSIQPDLASGTYVVTIQTETSVEQRKLIKK
jgi:hypothetical protein